MPPSYSFLQPVFDHTAFRSALDALQNGTRSGASLSGLTGTAKALVVAGLAHKIQRPLVVLTTDNESAERLAKAARTVLNWLEPGAHSRIHVLPAPDCSPYENRSPHPEISERRAVALWHAACGRTRILFAPLAAALGRFRESHYYRSLALDLKLGDEVSLDDLVEHLTAVGYESGEPVATPAQYSVRGGIVDLFPPEVECPVRLEFFGDRIESIREFDPGTQRSRKAAGNVTLLPFCENRHSPQLFARLVQTLTARVPHLRGEPEWAAEYSGQFPGWEFFVPLVEPAHGTLLTLFARPVLIWDEPVERRTQLQKTLE
ncbi:MAG: transcription-repair coupling factor, partial [Terriglobia bacterium]